jgi:alpha/beta superfamily hydrolase
MTMRRQFKGVVVLSLLMAASAVFAADTIRLTADDGAEIRADLYRAGGRAVVLAHGGKYTRESWHAQAVELRARGFTVLALDFRGFGESVGPGKEDPLTAPLYLDLLAAVRYLHANGARSVAIVGGSLGGMAAGDAMLRARPGEIDRVVFLSARASLAGGDIAKMPGRKLFIVARDDPESSGAPRLTKIRADFERVPEPRQLIVVDGAAHAQALFETTQETDVFIAIANFLAAD